MNIFYFQIIPVSIKTIVYTGYPRKMIILKKLHHLKFLGHPADHMGYSEVKFDINVSFGKVFIP